MPSAPVGLSAVVPTGMITESVLLICNLVDGDNVPIPTLPLLWMRIFSLFAILNFKLPPAAEFKSVPPPIVCFTA